MIEDIVIEIIVIILIYIIDLIPILIIWRIIMYTIILLDSDRPIFKCKAMNVKTILYKLQSLIFYKYEQKGDK
jgi:hypothetical protein